MGTKLALVVGDFDEIGFNNAEAYFTDMDKAELQGQLDETEEKVVEVKDVVFPVDSPVGKAFEVLVQIDEAYNSLAMQDLLCTFFLRGWYAGRLHKAEEELGILERMQNKT